VIQTCYFPVVLWLKHVYVIFVLERYICSLHC